MVERQHLHIHALPRLGKVIVRLCIRCRRELTAIPLVGEPALRPVNIVIPIAEEEIGHASRAAMVDVDKDILAVDLCPRQGKPTFEHLGIHAHAPCLVFAEAAADVDVLARRRPSGEHLCILRDRGFRRALRHNIDRPRCRCCTAVRPVVRHAHTVDRRIRSRGDVHASDDMRGRRCELVEQTRHTVQHEMIAVHIDAAHGEIRIHR